MFVSSHIAVNQVLKSAILICLFFIPTTVALLVFDQRLLDGEAIWLKPLKFHLALALHGLTVVFAIRMLPAAWQNSLMTKLGLGILGAVIIYESLFLSIQAGRGVRSHFNSETLFDSIGGSIMAGGAGILVLIPFVLGIALVASLFRDGLAGAMSDPLRVGMALGLILSSWLGAQAGSAIGANGGPFVGEVVGPYIPLTGWSLSGGDYRIGHFLGTHAMQILPMLAVALSVLISAKWALILTLPISIGWVALTLFALSRAGAGMPPF
jgi:hypothetical protein